MPPLPGQMIEALHQVPFRYVLTLTGGGTGAAAALLTVPGGSRTVLEVSVPYGEQALAEHLGYIPDHFCSPETALILAERAQTRAAWLAPGELVAGAGCTASLATDRPKRGDHRFYIAVAARETTFTCSLTLNKGERDRAGEEAVLDAVLLNALAEAFGVTERAEVPLLPGEGLQTAWVPGPGDLAAFFRGELPRVCVAPDGRVRDSGVQGVLVPGAFNPIHEGHWGLATVAAQIAGLPAAFELSVTNVDKPSLTSAEVRRRLTQFAWHAPVWLSRAPTFREKARLFPGSVFAVGRDTAERILAPRYYQDSEQQRDEALEGIRGQNCRFLVAGRLDAQDRFGELHHLEIPEKCRDLFAAIPEDLFRADVSSTALRRLAGGE